MKCIVNVPGKTWQNRLFAIRAKIGLLARILTLGSGGDLSTGDRLTIYFNPIFDFFDFRAVFI